MPILKPFFSYMGAKWTLAKHYPDPKYGIVVEPFAGSACYALRHYTKEVILVDLNQTICGIWDYLIKVSSEEIMALPDFVYDQDDLVGQPQEVKDLVGFWLNRCCSSPVKSLSSWGRTFEYPWSFWGEEIRYRIAAQVEHIRHWSIINGPYDCVPNDSCLTYFIDPPYQGLNEYPVKFSQFDELADFCKTRKGQVIVCERNGADWLPFQHFRYRSTLKSRGSMNAEVVYLQDLE